MVGLLPGGKESDTCGDGLSENQVFPRHAGEFENHATLLLGSFITTLAETLMNNGLPMIMEETHVSQMSAQ